MLYMEAAKSVKNILFIIYYIVYDLYVYSYLH